jgi:acetyl-CoA synthetase
VLYVRLKPGAVDVEATRVTLVGSITEQLGKPMRPNQILFVDDLPRTASGKVLRRVVRGLHLDPNFSAPLSLENPGSVAAVKQAR